MVDKHRPRVRFGEPLGYTQGRFVEPPELNRVLELIARGEPAVLVLGAPGTGKTTLLAAIADRLGDSAVGPISARHGNQTLRDALDADRDSPVLLIDGLDEMPLHEQEAWRATTPDLLRPRPGRQVVVSSRLHVVNFERVPTVVLAGLRHEAARAIVERFLDSVPREQVERVLRDAFAERGTSDQPPTWRELLTLLNERFARYEIPTGPEPSDLFRLEQTSVLGPDGIPLREADPRFKAHIARLVEVSDEVLRWLAEDPRRAHELNPREFERVVAELLTRQGYSVELTPATRDGGFDIRAASDNALGSFLYLVECKKYAERRPVGVQIVRNLAGVVHATGATAGILVTTSSFTRDAHEFRHTIEHQMSLRQFDDLATWLRPAR